MHSSFTLVGQSCAQLTRDSNHNNKQQLQSAHDHFHLQSLCHDYSISYAVIPTAFLMYAIYVTTYRFFCRGHQRNGYMDIDAEHATYEYSRPNIQPSHTATWFNQTASEYSLSSEDSETWSLTCSYALLWLIWLGTHVRICTSKHILESQLFIPYHS